MAMRYVTVPVKTLPLGALWAPLALVALTLLVVLAVVAAPSTYDHLVTNKSEAGEVRPRTGRPGTAARTRRR